MIKQVIGVIPQSCGDYNPERPGGYDKAERVFLFGCEWESKVDGNTYAPAVKDSEGKIIPDEEHWYHCSGMTDAEEATQEHHGLMSAEDKIKLDGIEEGAQRHIAPTSDEVKSALGTGSGTEKFLREDGTWQEVGAFPEVVQTTGQSTTAVMSQKAVSDKLSSIAIPDEEDLTVVNNYIKFKDRPNTDGMGKIILRKNMVSDVNTLTQSMISQANTIYVIQYDFALGEDITVPANCILEFDGGSISGAYTLDISNTFINGNECFSYNVTLAGSCKNTTIPVEWFIGTDLQKIQAAMTYANTSVVKHSSTGTSAYKVSYKKVLFANNKHYVIDNSINLPLYTHIEGNNALIEITTNNNIMSANSAAYICIIKDITLLGADVCGLYLNVGNLDAANTMLSNIIFETNTITKNKFGIYLNNQSSQCLIEKCTARMCPNFLKVANCDNLILRDCWINGWGDTHTKPDDTCSIEISTTRYTAIENCQFVPMWEGVTYPNDARWIDWKSGNLSINNCIFGGENSGIPIIWKYTNSSYSLSIENSQCASGAIRNKSGLVTLMNDVVPGYIRIKNSSFSNLIYRIINPYGYVKDDVVDYDAAALQSAWDKYVDKIVELGGGYGHIEVDTVEEIYQSYPIYPILSSKNCIYVNNIDMSKTYVIAERNLPANNNNLGFAQVATFEVLVSGISPGPAPFSAIYRFRYILQQRANLIAAKMNSIDSLGINYYNVDPTTKITVTLDQNFNLNFSGTDNYRIDAFTCRIVDNTATYPISAQDKNIYANRLVLLPQKCTIIS